MIPMFLVNVIKSAYICMCFVKKIYYRFVLIYPHEPPYDIHVVYRRLLLNQSKMYISVRVLLWMYDDVLVNKIEFAICTYQCEFLYEIIYCFFVNARQS